MNTEADIVERLRKHVNDRGGASIDNGAWQMMLDAASEIEGLRMEHQYACQELGVAIAERDAAARDMRERCAKVAEEMSENPNWSPSEQDGAFSLAKMLRLLPDTPAILATSGKDAT
ncbi:hypothetical protein RPMA_18180 [Tardiphaga alba]|uniref:Uncharacterized protein n=1 Tax=Tardiphaga alba TaxID=340268 RepID=A0ABX8A9X1_9BRAD|nr:hypothetical protein [Tardiphaga alba]QUS40546.1 hypothetical protein RPMA_18180 [Tardiphaga alba]